MENNIDIKPNSVIVVKQNDIETKYKNSSKANIYSSHQEILLELFEDIA